MYRRAVNARLLGSSDFPEDWEHGMDWLDGLLGGSPVVTGGAALALFGLLAVWLRDVPAKVFGWAKHFFVSTLTVDSRDELMFPALVEYMDSREALRRLNNFTARAVRQGTSYQSLHDELQQGGRPLTVLSPGEGFHIFYLDGRVMWMKREVQSGGPAIFEKIALSTPGRDKRSLEALVHAAMEHRIARELNRIAVYMPSPYNNEWMRARLGNNRKLESVVLKAGQKEAILADLLPRALAVGVHRLMLEANAAEQDDDRDARRAAVQLLDGRLHVPPVVARVVHRSRRTGDNSQA